MKEVEDRPIREKIITTDGNIVISASAGTGKTYMTVARIKHDLELIENYQTFAAITFTNKAAKEIQSRLGKDAAGFVGTNDSFVICEIIKPFAKDVFVELDSVEISSDYTDNAKLEDGNKLLSLFKCKGIIGTYADTHKNFAFKLALYILRKSHVASRYIKSKYFRIYIDEYQDSDFDMHKLFCFINSELDILLFVVGDKKQSIYEWRGGYPKGFQQFIDNSKFTPFELKNNFRSNIQIQNYSNIFLPEVRKNYSKAVLNGQVQGIKFSDDLAAINYIKEWLNLKTKCGFLHFSNSAAKAWAEKLHEANFEFIPKAPLDDPKLENNQIWIARGIASFVLKKRYNEFSLYDEIPNQEHYDIAKIKKNLLDIKQLYITLIWNEKIESYVKDLYRYLLGEYDEEKCIDEISALKETFESPIYIKSYNSDDYERITTTIHSTKGLQYEQVIVFASDYISAGKMNDEVHYVAITRPETKLLVLFDQNKYNAKLYYKLLQAATTGMNNIGKSVSISDVIEIRLL